MILGIRRLDDIIKSRGIGFGIDLKLSFKSHACVNDLNHQ